MLNIGSHKFFNSSLPKILICSVIRYSSSLVSLEDKDKLPRYSSFLFHSILIKIGRKEVAEWAFRDTSPSPHQIDSTLSSDPLWKLSMWSVGSEAIFLLQSTHCLVRAETLSAINHLSTFLSGRIGQTYHLCLNSDHSVSRRSLECSAHVSRFVCLLMLK